MGRPEKARESRSLTISESNAESALGLPTSAAPADRATAGGGFRGRVGSAARRHLLDDEAAYKTAQRDETGARPQRSSWAPVKGLVTIALEFPPKAHRRASEEVEFSRFASSARGKGQERRKLADRACKRYFAEVDGGC